MGVKELFSAIFTVLFRYRKFWRELKEEALSEELHELKDYAVPLIAMVQLCKFPLIGLPRQAMFFALANFLIDVAALYLLIGGTAYLLEREHLEHIQDRMLKIVCYSMTPVWLFELLYFTGIWSWLFAFLALFYMLLIGRNGMAVMLEFYTGIAGKTLRNTALFVVTVNTSVFLLIRAVMRLFNF
ncbi:MAG: hypothetical protein FDX12_02580 [Chlorobium sp.]|nr:MAG: hypothetical protein FDX12_02580 [Chlorobium sp.]